MENLVLNDHSIDTLDEIVDYLVPSTDLLRQFRDETLWKWLYEHGEDDKSNKVHELNKARELNGKSLDDTETLIQLIDVLGLGDDAKAMYTVGKMYLDRYRDKNGDKAESDAKAAVSYFRKAADAGSVEAMFELGRCYEEEWGVDDDLDEAEKWYEKAARLGHVEAQYNLAYSYLHYWEPEDYDDKEEEEKYLRLAVEWLRKAVDKNSVDAQYELGQCYFYGRGVDEDGEEAVRWYRVAADKGHVDAQYELGQCYFYGWGVDEDREEAVRWYRVAADKGHVEAQRELGKCYLYGFGVDADGEEGADLLRKAADKNDAAAKYHLGNCYRYEIGRAFNRQEAFVLYDAAAKAGNHLAQVALGKMYLEGDKRMYIRKNLPEAIKWLRQAVEGNNPDAEAARLLGKCYYSGEGVGSVNKKEALRLYHIAANGGDAKAMYNLAVCYLTGAGGEKNLAVAKFWAERAIESEDESVVEDAKKLLVKIPAP